MSAFTVDAFFDQPNLIGARFSHPGRATEPSSFALGRRPDVESGSGLGMAGGLAIAGVCVAALAIGVYILTGEDSTQLTVHGTVERDANGNDWHKSLGRDLAYDFAPHRPELTPFQVRTLLDVPGEMVRRGGDSDGGWIKARCTEDDRLARRRGERLARTLDAAGNAVAVILDLPGPMTVSAASGMAGRCDPVVAFDSLPHPSGVVAVGDTLGSLMYWRPEFAATRPLRANDAPPVFLLDAGRLAPYAGETDRFDNRSTARLPDAAALRALGITRVLYVREKSGSVQESDDLVKPFLALAEAGIEVRHLGLDSLDDGDSGQLLTHRYGWVPHGLITPTIHHDDADYRTAQRSTMFDRNPPALDGGMARRQEVMNGLIPRNDYHPSGPVDDSTTTYSRSTSFHSSGGSGG